jgi:dihydrofolate reductase
MIIGIVAIASDNAIGKAGKLPWHYPADLIFFKRSTVHNAVVMGSTTWRSIGKPLPDRLNIVLSRSQDIELPLEVIRLGKIEEVISLSAYLRGNLYVIGGAKVFAGFADYIDEWLVTDIPVKVPEADTFMQANLLNGFQVVASEELGGGLTVRRLRRTRDWV